MSDKLKHGVREMVNARTPTASTSAFAKSAWGRMLGTDAEPTDVARVTDAHMGKMAEWSGVTKQLFAAMYDPAGMKKYAEDDMDPTGGEFIHAAESQATWGELRAAGRCHPQIAADATKTLAEAVAAATGLDKLPDDEEASKSPEDLQDEKEMIEDMEVDPDDEQAKQDKQAALDEIERAKKKAQARRDAIAEKLGKARNNGTIGRAVKQAAQEANEQAEAVIALRTAGIGKGGGDHDAEITPDLIKQARKLKNFSRIIDLVGRMQQATDAKAEEALSVGKLAPTGMTTGDDITHLASSEWVKDTVDEDLFLLDVVEKRAVVTEFESPEPKHKGDVIILVDRSGSMDGERIEWARALAFAAIQRAEQDDRRWVLTLYADYNSTLPYSSSEKGIQHALRTLSVNPGGGTDTNWALHQMLTRTDLGTLRDPDVLLVTDGDWPDLSDDTRAIMETLKMRLFVVMLEGGRQDVPGATRVFHIDSLNIDHAAQILASVTI